MRRLILAFFILLLWPVGHALADKDVSTADTMSAAALGDSLLGVDASAPAGNRVRRIEFPGTANLLLNGQGQFVIEYDPSVIRQDDQPAEPCTDGYLWMDTNGATGERIYVCEDGAWVQSSGSGTMTGEEIAAAYEAEPDRNAYTDAEQAAVAALGTAATLDATTTGWATGKLLKFDASGNLVVGDDNEGSGTLPTGIEGDMLYYTTGAWTAQEPDVFDVDGTTVIKTLTDGVYYFSVPAIDASGFDGNLATTDDTLQEVAQKVDDLSLGSGAGLTSAIYVQYSDSTCTPDDFYFNGAGEIVKCITDGDLDYPDGTDWTALSPATYCTGDTIFEWHAENVDVTSGTPSGCSALGDTVATASGAVALVSSDKSDGTYSIEGDGSTDYYVFDISEGFSSDEGTLWLDVKPVTYSSGGEMLVLEASTDVTSDFISMQMAGGAGAIDLRGYYKGQGTAQYVSANTDINEADGKWWRIKYQWKVSATSADHRLDVWELDSSDPRVTTGSAITAGAEDDVSVHDSSIDTLMIGDVSGGAALVDNIKLLNTSEL